MNIQKYMIIYSKKNLKYKSQQLKVKIYLIEKTENKSWSEKIG